MPNLWRFESLKYNYCWLKSVKNNSVQYTSLQWNTTLIKGKALNNNIDSYGTPKQ